MQDRASCSLCPSGTEEVYKIYAEGFRGQEHLEQIHRDSQTAVARFFEASGPRNPDRT